MNPTRKLRESQFIGLTKSGRALFLLPNQHERPRNAEQIKLAEKFCRANLIGGTFVTYADGYKFSMEESRTEVDEVLLENGGLGIKTTDGKVPLLCGMLDLITFSERKGVFYLDVPCIGCYAVAPKGTVIHPTETMDEAIEASKKLLREGVGKACGHDAPKPATVAEKFRKTDFAGGTLVEYANAFGIEFGRGTVTRFSIDGGRLFIASDGKTMLSYPNLNELRIEKMGDVFLIYGDYCSCYALAPAGVEIPGRPTVDEVRDAMEVLAAGKNVDGMDK